MADNDILDKFYEEARSIFDTFYQESHLKTWVRGAVRGHELGWTDEDMKACWVASATLHGSGNWDFTEWLKLRKENK